MYASVESDREFARNAGAETPSAAWILAPSDTWMKNPHYHGPPVPHPEDDEAEYYDTADTHDYDNESWMEFMTYATSDGEIPY